MPANTPIQVNFELSPLPIEYIQKYGGDKPAHEVTPADILHQLLCLAIHEVDQGALEVLTDYTVSINLPEPINSHPQIDQNLSGQGYTQEEITKTVQHLLEGNTAEDLAKLYMAALGREGWQYCIAEYLE